MPEPLKCWIDKDADVWLEPALGDTAAIAVPLDLLERLVKEIEANGGSWYTRPKDIEDACQTLTTLIRELREEG